MAPRAHGALHRWPPSVVYLTTMLLMTAIFGGVGAAMLISDPSGGTWGIPTVYRDLLPVGDFLLPGLFLAVAFCAFPLVIAFGLAARRQWGWSSWVERQVHRPWPWVGTLALAATLVAWIAVEAALFWQAPDSTMTNLWIMVLALAGALLIGAALPGVRRYCAAA